MQIEELEAALESSKDADMVESLQSRLESATEQVKDLQAQVKDITMWRDKYAKESEYANPHKVFSKVPTGQ